MLAACTGGAAEPGETRGPAGPAYRFADVTAEAGIPTAKTRSWGAFWGNFDNDGSLPDIFISRHARPPWVLAGSSSGFRLLAVEAFYPSYFDRHGCAWGEANGDGRPDFFCTQGADVGKGSGPKQLLVATDSGLTDRAGALGVTAPLARGRSVNWLDYDLDGDLDLFLGNKRRPGYGNVMFENSGSSFRPAAVGVEEELRTVNSTWADWDSDSDPDLLVLQYPPYPTLAYENAKGQFERVDVANVTGDSWLSAAWGDYDGDGRPDLHLVSDTRSLVLHNSGGEFRVADERALDYGRMSTWLDVENDGDLDLFVVQGDSKEHPEAPGNNHPDFLIIQGGRGFRRVDGQSFRGPMAGYGDAVAAADYNRDGRVDLFVSNGHGPRPSSGVSELLENRSDAGRWAGLILRGDASNPLGFGATVEVTAGELRYRRQLTDSFNFRSQDEVGYVHMGLAEATSARVEVTWPGGGSDCVEVPAGEIAELEKGTQPCD